MLSRIDTQTSTRTNLAHVACVELHAERTNLRKLEPFPWVLQHSKLKLGYVSS